MRFDGGFCFSKSRPREEGQTKIDCGGIEGVGRRVQFDSKTVVGVQRLSGANQRLSEIGPDAPIAVLVGVGERASRNRAAKPHVVELGLMGAKTAFDIAQTLPIRQLGKGHAEELIHARKTFDIPLAAISLDTTGKFFVG